jgi:hypothetical protein
VTYDVLTPGVARLWPYSPDWSRPFDVKRSFLTDVATSRDKTEQRRATRDEPRLSVQYQAVVSGADRRAADHHLRSWQNKPVVVPDFGHAKRVRQAHSRWGRLRPWRTSHRL